METFELSGGLSDDQGLFSAGDDVHSCNCSPACGQNGV